MAGVEDNSSLFTRGRRVAFIWVSQGREFRLAVYPTGLL